MQKRKALELVASALQLPASGDSRGSYEKGGKGKVFGRLGKGKRSVNNQESDTEPGRL